MIKNILITGCNGQLGNEMQLQAKKPENSAYNYFFTDVEELDITDEKAVNAFVEDNAIDCIVNCAAYTNVDKSESNAELARLLNSVAPGYLAAAVGKRGGLMVQISTDYVFDGTNHLPYREDEPTKPIGVYGVTKLDGEKAVSGLLEKYYIVRIAWVFGRNGKNFIRTMLKVGKTHDTVRVVNDQIGTPTYTLDLARLVADMAETDRYGYYHVTNEGGYISWYDFTCEIFRQAGYTTKVVPVTTAEYGLSKAARPFNSRLDRSKIAENGFKPLPDWKDALRRYLSELKKDGEY